MRHNITSWCSSTTDPQVYSESMARRVASSVSSNIWHNSMLRIVSMVSWPFIIRVHCLSWAPTSCHKHVFLSELPSNIFISVAERGTWKILRAVATGADLPLSRQMANWMHRHTCRQLKGQMYQIRFMRSVFPANKAQIAVWPVITFLCLNECETDNPAFGGDNTDRMQTLFL